MKRFPCGVLAGAVWVGVLLLVAGAGAGWAGDLRIEAVDPNAGLVFQTPDTGAVDHQYRIESATSLVSAAWSSVATVTGVGPSVSVTTGVATAAATMFYRVVGTSNVTAFVDGAYLAIDVSGGTGATAYAVAYYDTAAAVPGGLTNDTYKTEQILLRRIPGGSFTMGSPSNELGRYTDEAQHQATLTKDLYVGVFEVTQKQWERVMGTWPSYFNNATCRDSRPVERVSYYEIRENPANSAIATNWPLSNAVHADSFVGRLRAKAGLATLDLPTEAQWEYACRAETSTALNSGKNLTSQSQCPNMSEMGRYLYNGGSGSSQGSDTSRGTAKAGSYLPNVWGLHDMHGNVWEWCLDWNSAYAGPEIDPGGPGSGSFRLFRGGSWSSIAEPCRSATRDSSRPTNRFNSGGLRLAMPAP
ncbi:MAG: formylglycine-generating enzyme family protein [Lentisphaerae bacterium]|nr:formylglycine-generating enzyme family protein [Lentisphaerota bacterium]